MFTDVCSRKLPIPCTLSPPEPLSSSWCWKELWDKTTLPWWSRWLRCHAPHAGALEFHPWSETRVPHAANKTRRSQVNWKKKKTESAGTLLHELYGIHPSFGSCWSAGRGRGKKSLELQFLSLGPIGDRSNVKSRQSWNRVSLVISFCPGKPAIVIKTQQNRTFLDVSGIRTIHFLHSMNTQNQGV